MSLKRASAIACLAFLVGSLLAVAPASAATTAVDAVNFTFSPESVEIASGGTVSWTNKDQEPHTATADDGSFSVLFNPGETKSFTFAKDGTFAYYCKFHGSPGGGGMSGTVKVGVGSPATVKIAGADNVARAVAWSKHNHPDGSGFALLGRSDLFADSLASGAAQGKLDAPLLLTASNALDARTKDELTRLKARTVYILGGTGAISAGVEATLKNSGLTVRRLAGNDRIGTAIAVADTLFPETTSALLVRANGPGTAAFADALGAGAVAAGTGKPVLFSDTASLSGATKAYIQSHPISSVDIIGGTAALSDQVAKDLGALNVETNRTAGVDRFQTASAVGGMVGGDGPGPMLAVFVDGVSPDGWADGFAAAGAKAPVLLTSGDAIPGATAHDVGHGGPGLALVCGATVTATACGRLEVVRSSDTDNTPKVGAIMTAVPGGDTRLGGATGLYATSDPTALCYDYFGTPIELTSAHIHRVADKSAAIPLVLELTSDGDRFGCGFGLSAAVIADVFANPADYYINIHTAAYPSGAISGPATHVKDLGNAGMVNDAEVPGPGDPGGAGFAFLITTDTPGQVCAAVFTFGLDGPPTSAHIHQAAAGSSGPAVITLVTPTEGSIPLNCYTVSDSLLAAMKTDITQFYVNVHTAKFPSGAIRGQLLKPPA